MGTGRCRHPVPRSVSRWLLIATVVVLSPSGSAAGDQDFYYDYAPVLETTPILEARSVPVARQECHDVLHAAWSDSELMALAGDVRTATPHTTLGSAIRQGRPETTRASLQCETIQTYATRQRIIAYQVRYRFGDDVFVRRMQQDPGDRVRVRVQLRPQQ